MAFIDKGKLLHEISLNGSTWAKGYHFSWSHGLEAKNRMVRLIEEQPTVDAEPVRHGRWMSFEEYCQKLGADPETYTGGWSFCSECEKPMRSYYGWNYCPNCGAKMDAEVE